MIVYIDDILLMGESPEHLEGQLKDLLTGLGFIINIPKSITALAQQIKYLGLLVCIFDPFTPMYVSLLGEKLHHIRSEMNQITKKSSQIPARQPVQILEKLSAAYILSSAPCPLFYRSLQGDL